MILPAQITPASILTTFLASFLVWILYLSTLFILVKKPKIKREFLVHALFSGLVSWFAAYAIKQFIPATRPFEVNAYPPLTITVPFENSFPSGHVALAFGLAVAFFLHNKKLGLVYILGAILVGIGRIVSNAHYPIDVVGGAVLGSFIALITENIFIRKFLREK